MSKIFSSHFGQMAEISPRKKTTLVRYRYAPTWIKVNPKIKSAKIAKKLIIQPRWIKLELTFARLAC